MELFDVRIAEAGEVCSILNDAIQNSYAIYDETPRSVPMIETWLLAQHTAGRPVVGVRVESDLAGYGSFGQFRVLPGYRSTVEHSIYVAAGHRRTGVGGKLLAELVRRAELQNLHAMVGLIDAANGASRRLHERAGFRLVGTMPEVAIKFGRWLDVCVYQRNFGTPESAVRASPALPAGSTQHQPGK